MSNKVHITTRLVIYLLGLLNVVAGIPKILQMSQELGFLSAIGFGPTAVSALGVVQVLGGILLFIYQFRIIGAALAAVALALSSIAIFAGGNMSFGFVSLLPLIVLVFVVGFERKKTAGNSG